jgi:hypothetical protein
MNLFTQILNFLNAEMTRPIMYGTFHIIALILTIAVTIFVAKKFSNADDAQNKKILITIASILIIFEVIKQTIYPYSSTGWNYSWHIFPFQFCSVPIYALVVALFTKGKTRQALYSFLATFALFAGLAVMLYPVDVYVEKIAINVQTMVHHGLMLVTGVYLIASGRVPLKHKSMIGAVNVFLIFLIIAFTMNYIAHFAELEATFNMFFISPFFDNHLPILNVIQANYSYPVFLLSYIFGFTLVAYIMLLIAMIINLIKKCLTTYFNSKKPIVKH